MGYYEKNGDWNSEDKKLFGERGERILNWSAGIVIALAVVYFTLRVFEIIPNSA